MYLDNVDNKKIDDAIKASGLKKKFIAQELDITYNSLRRKLLGEVKWSNLELEKVYKILENYINL
ncbi:MAG: hypothetical protein J6D47_01285 [Peptostreptococcaceae bacterium]|nr:hypothetical protein [Peptostreptococcaceae bacterium]